MENINIEEYIKDLSPELQEKARACKNSVELFKLAKNNKVPLPDDALEAVAGGADVKPGGYTHSFQCTNCSLNGFLTPEDVEYCNSINRVCPECTKGRLRIWDWDTKQEI